MLVQIVTAACWLTCMDSPAQTCVHSQALQFQESCSFHTLLSYCLHACQHPPVALQVLNIPTKINKGTVEITSNVALIKAGEKVGASEATLLAKLGIKPFSYGLIVQHVSHPLLLLPTSHGRLPHLISSPTCEGG